MEQVTNKPSKINYRSALRLIKENFWIIKFTSILFLSMILIGILFPNMFNELKHEIIKSLRDKAINKNYYEITIFIIKNNATVAFLSILLGAVFFPIIAIVINGYFIGSIIYDSIMSASLFSIWKLMPHGIFEIPAIILSFSFGLKIGLCWFKRDRTKNIKKSYREALIVFLSIILPLLIVAGIIEGALFIYTKNP